MVDTGFPRIVPEPSNETRNSGFTVRCASKKGTWGSGDSPEVVNGRRGDIEACSDCSSASRCCISDPISVVRSGVISLVGV